MDLFEIRKNIDKIDNKIVKLLDQRMELTLRTTRFKKKIQDKNREKEIIDNAAKMPVRFMSKDFIKNFFISIMAESRQLQGRGPKLVGFQGEHGANTEVAILANDPALVPIPCMKIVDVFEGVLRGDFNFGLVPVENSLEGAVVGIDDLLIEHDIFIVDEVKLKINHALLTLPETDFNGIKVVYSHPQAIGQCSRFVRNYHLEAHPFYNTAGAARMLASTMPRASAVIASKLCAEIYDLKIIKENIGDDSSNFTRFIFLSKEKNKEEGNKCSIVFIINSRSGALYNILKLFADSGINLSRIESRPSKTNPENTAFLVDFHGSINDKRVSDTLTALEKKSIMYKLLGCYREATISSD